MTFLREGETEQCCGSSPELSLAQLDPSHRSFPSVLVIPHLLALDVTELEVHGSCFLGGIVEGLEFGDLSFGIVNDGRYDLGYSSLINKVRGSLRDSIVLEMTNLVL